MEGFSLLIGHMLGDYIFQNDWMAKNKTKSHWACLVHCFWYTVAIAATCIWFVPWYLIVAVGMAHFPVDRWRLARWCMTQLGQEEFATGPLSPWSIIVVDNTIHLLVLYAAGAFAVDLFSHR